MRAGAASGRGGAPAAGGGVRPLPAPPPPHHAPLNQQDRRNDVCLFRAARALETRRPPAYVTKANPTINPFYQFCGCLPIRPPSRMRRRRAGGRVTAINRTLRRALRYATVLSNTKLYLNLK
ncbi:hypothetical protein EVAR_9038_1 [Eumeta japonica]|uniref:Uncharacterized protein n=1 Tax=Eumeta variegata TaxID=151549 RepID=A0A4C1TX12_EUMVA|nr:hypothetical protein EVAR_9038_1 [Eumeta japonica]